MDEMGDLRKVTVRLSDRVFAALWAEAQTKNTSVSELMRNLVEERLGAEAAVKAVPTVRSELERALKPVAEDLRIVRIAAEAATWAASFAAVAVGGERTASFTEGRFVQAAREEAIVAIARMDAHWEASRSDAEGEMGEEGAGAPEAD